MTQTTTSNNQAPPSAGFLFMCVNRFDTVTALRYYLSHGAQHGAAQIGDNKMNGLKIEINFEDIVSDMFASADCDEYSGCTPSSSFKEAVQSDLISQVVRDLKKTLTDQSISAASEKAQSAADSFINYELEALVKTKLMSGELQTRSGPRNVDDIITDRISRISIEQIIQRHIDKKAEAFAADMKARYDNIFAAKIVGSLNQQKMLSPEIAKILLGE